MQIFSPFKVQVAKENSIAFRIITICKHEFKEILEN